MNQPRVRDFTVGSRGEFGLVEDQPSANIRAPDSQRLRPPPRNPPLDARGVERW